MNKTYIFKRNRSQDVWRPVQQTPTSRRRSLTRERDAASRAGGVYKSEFPLHESLTRTSNSIGTGGSPSMRRLSSQSPSVHQGKTRHRDLKRKFIFKLHDEIEKPIHTTVLEEISDLDRITSICLSTLHQMMENKHQRKFLHHMNNVSNNSNNNHQSLLNLSNNSSQPPPAPMSSGTRKKSTPRASFSVIDSDKVSSTVERFISATL